MRPSRWVHATVWLGLLGRASAAGAQMEGSDRDNATSETVSLAYFAVDGCPNQGQFVDRVGARTKRFKLAPPADEHRRFWVTIRDRSNGFTGTFAARDDRGETTREIPGATCDEVTEALSLIVALTIDPEADTRPMTRPLSPTPIERQASPTPTTTRTTADPVWRFAFGGGGEAVLGLWPQPTFDLAITVQMGRSTRERLLFPQLGLGFADTPAIAISSAFGSASVDWTRGWLSVCPWGAELTRSVWALPCAKVELGRVSALGVGVVAPQRDSRVWAALGASGRIDWAPWEHLHFQIEVGLLAPLSEYFVYVEPNSRIYTVSRIGGTGTLVGLLQFP